MTSANSSELDPRFTAGFKLLSKFQNQWTQIHSRSEINTSKARDALAKIDGINQALGGRQRALDEMKVGIKYLSNIQDQINRLDTDIEMLEGCFEKIEDLLIVLKNRKEIIDTESYVENCKSVYNTRVVEYREASEMRRDRLKSEHLLRVEKFELEQQKELEERRKMLERAFEEEKNLYLRRSGS